MGIAAGVEEGIELNVFGLTVGIDPNDRDLKPPILGRVGGARSAEPIIVGHQPTTPRLPSQ